VRYTRIQTVITKTFDGNIDTPEHMKSIFESMKTFEHDCDITLYGGLHYKWARVLEVKEDEILFLLILNKNSSLKKWVPYSDIKELIVETLDGEIPQGKKVSRWTLLDGDV
jgi:hypothetical protein